MIKKLALCLLPFFAFSQQYTTEIINAKNYGLTKDVTRCFSRKYEINKKDKKVMLREMVIRYFSNGLLKREITVSLDNNTPPYLKEISYFDGMVSRINLRSVYGRKTELAWIDQDNKKYNGIYSVILKPQDLLNSCELSLGTVAYNDNGFLKEISYETKTGEPSNLSSKGITRWSSSESDGLLKSASQYRIAYVTDDKDVIVSYVNDNLIYSNFSNNKNIEEFYEYDTNKQKNEIKYVFNDSKETSKKTIPTNLIDENKSVTFSFKAIPNSDQELVDYEITTNRITYYDGTETGDLQASLKSDFELLLQKLNYANYTYEIDETTALDQILKLDGKFEELINTVPINTDKANIDEKAQLNFYVDNNGNINFKNAGSSNIDIDAKKNISSTTYYNDKNILIYNALTAMSYYVGDYKNTEAVNRNKWYNTFTLPVSNSGFYIYQNPETNYFEIYAFGKLCDWLEPKYNKDENKVDVMLGSEKLLYLENWIKSGKKNNTFYPLEFYNTTTEFNADFLKK